MNEEPRSFRDRLLGNVCQYDYLMYFVLVLEIMLFLLGILSYLFAELSDETRTILLLDFLLLGIVFAGTVAVIVICGRTRS